MTGLNAYNNSYTAASVGAFSALAATNPIAGSALLRKTNVNYVKPEQVKAFELGYRSFISDVSVDINGYYNIYNDFIGNLNVVAPFYGTAQDAPNPLAADAGAQSLHALTKRKL